MELGLKAQLVQPHNNFLSSPQNCACCSVVIHQHYERAAVTQPAFLSTLPNNLPHVVWLEIQIVFFKLFLADIHKKACFLWE